MDNLDFIIRNMRWSYSRINSFENCKYGWYLTYIKGIPSINNFFSDFGSFGHEILEKYLKKELTMFELADYYTENYDDNITSKAPPFPKNMAGKYYLEGLSFFENFTGFDKEIVGVEDKINFTTKNGYEFIGYLDLLLKDDDGEYIVVDHKCSNPYRKKTTKKNGVEFVLDNTKIKGYKKQMYIYAIDIKQRYGKFPKQMWINFFKANLIHKIDFVEEEYLEVVEWLNNSIDNILAETEWKENISDYFCKYLCGVRKSCFKI